MTIDVEALALTIGKGTSNRYCCQEVLDLVSGYNSNRNLSLEQIQSMITTFATAKLFLDEDMPATAKSAVIQIVPDENLVTAELKEMVMFIFEKYGF